MADQPSGCPCSSFSFMTHAASLFGALFILFLFMEATTIRWWVMLPLAAISFGLFFIQRGQTTGIEQKYCRWSLWIVVIAALLRDMCLSGQLVAALERMRAAGMALHG